MDDNAPVDKDSKEATFAAVTADFGFNDEIKDLFSKGLWRTWRAFATTWLTRRRSTLCDSRRGNEYSDGQKDAHGRSQAVHATDRQATSQRLQHQEKLPKLREERNRMQATALIPNHAVGGEALRR